MSNLCDICNHLKEDHQTTLLTGDTYGHVFCNYCDCHFETKQAYAHMEKLVYPQGVRWKIDYTISEMFDIERV